MFFDSNYGTAAEAIEQIKAKGYPEKYQVNNKPIHLIGISFDPESKSVTDLQHESTALVLQYVNSYGKI